MPISKRDKKVSLTKTKKKGLDHKKQLVTEIQQCIENYKRLFVISVQNMRNTKMGDVRHEWSSSRFFFGKNKVMSLALGKSKETEYRDNLHKIGGLLSGQTGLFFTNSSVEDVLKWFSDFVVDDFARSGNVASYTVGLQTGSIPSFSHSIEPQLRLLGLPTALEKGVVTLLKPYSVCKQGDVLNPEQARILKLFDHKMAKFQVKIVAVWVKSSSRFKSFKSKNLSDVPKDENKIVNICGENLKPKESDENDVQMESDKDEVDDDDEQ